jgi:hypothetical protein
MTSKFSINANTLESDRVDNRITQFFLPSARYNSPVVVTPMDIDGSEVLRATLTYGDLISSDSIFINTNASGSSVVITLPPVEDIFALFSYPVEGCTRSWNIGYDSFGTYNIVSPDTVDPPSGIPVQLFQTSQSVALVCMTLSIYPYGLSYGQDYGIFVTSSSNLSAISVDYTGNLVIGYNYRQRENITGYNNTIVGFQSGGMLTSGSNNTLIGSDTGNQLSIGQGNTIIGTVAGLLSTTGNFNTMVGNGAGYNITSGQYNVLIGNGACDNATTASGNVCIGNDTLENLRVGIDNTVVGNGAGNGFVEDSNGCIAIGAGSAGGVGVIGVNSTYIGVGATPSGNVTNETVIGTEVQGKGSNTTVIGGNAGCYFYSPCLVALYSSIIDSATSTIFWNGIISRGMDPSTNYQYLNFKIPGIYEITISGTLYTATAGTAVISLYKNGGPGFFDPLTIQTTGGTFTLSASSMGTFEAGDSCYFGVSSNVVSDPAMLCLCNVKYLSM